MKRNITFVDEEVLLILDPNGKRAHITFKEKSKLFNINYIIYKYTLYITNLIATSLLVSLSIFSILIHNIICFQLKPANRTTIMLL